MQEGHQGLPDANHVTFCAVSKLSGTTPSRSFTTAYGIGASGCFQLFKHLRMNQTEKSQLCKWKEYEGVWRSRSGRLLVQLPDLGRISLASMYQLDHLPVPRSLNVTVG